MTAAAVTQCESLFVQVLRRYSEADCQRGLSAAWSDDLRRFEGLPSASVSNIWPSLTIRPLFRLLVCLFARL